MSFKGTPCLAGKRKTLKMIHCSGCGDSEIWAEMLLDQLKHMVPLNHYHFTISGSLCLSGNQLATHIFQYSDLQQIPDFLPGVADERWPDDGVLGVHCGPGDFMLDFFGFFAGVFCHSAAEGVVSFLDINWP